MKKLASLFFILCAPISYGWAETYIIKDPSTSNKDFEARLLADSSLKPISNWAFQQNKQKANNYDLEQKFIDIQDALEKNKPATHKLLQAVYFDRYDYDWTELQRKILARVIRILSEAETHPLKKQKLEAEAENFHPDLQKQNFKKQSLKTLLPTEVLKNFQYASVNGQKRQFSEKFILPSTEFRLSLYSKSFRPQSFVLNSKELGSLIADKIPMALGSCETGFYESQKKQLPSETLISHKNCTQGFNEKKELLATPKIEHSFMKKTTRTITNKWLWIGAGVLAGAIIINNQKDSRKSPGTTVGF